MIQNVGLKKNFVYSIIYQILTLITPLITAPYVARVLGVEAIGRYSYTQSIVVYFSLIAAIGSGTYGQRGVAGFRGNKRNLSVFFYEIAFLRFITTGVSLLIYGVFVFSFGGAYSLLLGIQALTILANAFDITWLYQGVENFKTTVTRQIVIKIVSVAAVLMMVKSQGDLPIYVLCYCVPILVGNLWLWLGIGKIVEKVDFKDLKPIKHLKGELLLFFPFIATLIFSYVDKTMLGVMIKNGDIENGYYEQTLKFVSISASIVSAISAVLVPRMAYYFGAKDYEHIKAYIKKGCEAIMWVSCILTAGMFAVGRNVIPWFYGSGYEKSIELLQILSFITLFRGMNSFIGSAILIPSYKQNKYSIAIWSSTIFNVVCNGMLIPSYGAVGASVASVMSEILQFIVLLKMVKQFMTPLKFFKNSFKYIVASFVVILIISGLGRYLASSIMNSVVLVAASIGVYVICLLLMKDNFTILTLKNVVNRIKKA